MATDTFFHGFWFDLDSILGLKSEKWTQKNTAKTYLQNSHATNPDQFGTPPCGPLKEQIQGSQDWQPNPGP